MLKKISIFIYLVIMALSISAFAATPTAAFFIRGPVAYACVVGGPCNLGYGGAVCTTNNNMTEVYLFVSVNGSMIASSCGSDLACQCWNYAAGTDVSIYGKLYAVGASTLNRVTQITTP